MEAVAFEKWRNIFEKSNWRRVTKSKKLFSSLPFFHGAPFLSPLSPSFEFQCRKTARSIGKRRTFTALTRCATVLFRASMRVPHPLFHRARSKPNFPPSRHSAPNPIPPPRAAYTSQTDIAPIPSSWLTDSIPSSDIFFSQVCKGALYPLDEVVGSALRVKVESDAQVRVPYILVMKTE